MSEQSSIHGNRAVLERMWRIVTNAEHDQLETVLHPEFVQEIPQSGERVIGIENFRKILQHYPGEGSGPIISNDPYVAGDEEHYIMTPTFNVVRIENSGDQLTSYVKARYPDGSDWYIVTFSSFKDGKIIHRLDFYAPCFKPPEWRAEWVEVEE